MADTLPILLKFSCFPAVFAQAIIPSVIHILCKRPHADAALPGWMDDCLYFLLLGQCPAPFHCHLRGSPHHRHLNAVIA